MSENESTASDHEMPIGLRENSACPGDDTSNDEEDSDSNRDDGQGKDLDQFVYDTVLRLVEIKTSAGFSQDIFQDLQWGKDIANKVNTNIAWPSCWAEVLVLLEKFGCQSNTG